MAVVQARGQSVGYGPRRRDCCPSLFRGKHRSAKRITAGFQPVMPSRKVTISRHCVTRRSDTWATRCLGADRPRIGSRHDNGAGTGVTPGTATTQGPRDPRPRPSGESPGTDGVLGSDGDPGDWRPSASPLSRADQCRHELTQRSRVCHQQARANAEGEGEHGEPPPPPRLPPLRLTRTSSAHSVASALPGSATCAQRSLQSFLRSGFGILSTPPADRLTSTDVSAVSAGGPTCPAGAAVPGPRGQGVVVRTAPERLLPVTVRDERGRSRGVTDRSCRHAARRV
jgi:hypothetical protein